MMTNIHKFHTYLSAGNSKTILNVSDCHYDSKNCDRKLLKRHFDEAQEKNAWILINGDWFDMMGSKRDPRSIPNDIRPEYNKAGGSYLDLVIEDSYEFLKKYADNILIIGYGNHETNIVRRQQIDPLKYLYSLLKGDGSNIQLGGYQGYVHIAFQPNKKTTKMQTKKLFYHHGSGGNAKRTKGTLDIDINIMQHSWSDIITSGHDHNKWHHPVTLSEPNFKTLEVQERKIDVIRSGSYKMKSTSQGWEIEKAFNQPTLGGYWIDFVASNRREHGKSRYRINTRVTEAN